MQLKHPFGISSRLMPSVKIGDATLSLEKHHTNRSGRQVWCWYIDTPTKEWRGMGLNAPLFHGVQLVMADFAGFLEADGGHFLASNLECLFTKEVAQWASEHMDELLDLVRLLEETPNLVTEDQLCLAHTRITAGG